MILMIFKKILFIRHLWCSLLLCFCTLLPRYFLAVNKSFPLDILLVQFQFFYISGAFSVCMHSHSNYHVLFVRCFRYWKQIGNRLLGNWCVSPPSHLLTPPLSTGFRQHGGLPGQLLHPVHLIAPVHTATHHSRQPQGLNFLHGAGEGDRPLPPPLPCPAEVASAPLSAHLNLLLLLLLPSHVPSDQV